MLALCDNLHGRARIFIEITLVKVQLLMPLGMEAWDMFFWEGMWVKDHFTTSEERTIFVIVSSIHNIVGRDAGTNSQHPEQITHHSRVIRLHVSLALGQSGFLPVVILVVMATLLRISR